AVDALETLLPAVSATVATMTLNPERTMAAVDSSMLATDVAEFLVRSGVPFRSAHEMVGRLVRAAEEAGSSLEELPREKFVEISTNFQHADLSMLFDPSQSE